MEQEGVPLLPSRLASGMGQPMKGGQLTDYVQWSSGYFCILCPFLEGSWGRPGLLTTP